MAVLVYVVNITAYTSRIAVRDVAWKLMRKDCSRLTKISVDIARKISDRQTVRSFQPPNETSTASLCMMDSSPPSMVPWIS
jgi:hypothetical protein